MYTFKIYISLVLLISLILFVFNAESFYGTTRTGDPCVHAGECITGSCVTQWNCRFGRCPIGKCTWIGRINPNDHLEAFQWLTPTTTTTTTTTTTKDCSSKGYGNVDGYCYKAITTKMNWMEAQAKCSAIGGHLPYVDNGDKTRALMYEANTFPDECKNDAGTIAIWLGGVVCEEYIHWFSGTPDSNFDPNDCDQHPRPSANSYINWRDGEPDDYEGNEKCMETWTSDEKWNDVKCDARMCFICEYLDKSSPGCMPGYTNIHGYCYIGFDVKMNWKAAQGMCSLIEGHLPTINNAKQTNALMSAAHLFPDDCKIHVDTVSLWLGGVVCKKKIHWFSEPPNSDFNPNDCSQHPKPSTITYTNWRRNQPDDFKGNEKCMETWRSNRQWNDIPCDHEMCFICESNLRVNG